ncbi:MAG: hypothetical protein AAF696_09340 [Bacteroidota bacterium]
MKLTILLLGILAAGMIAWQDFRDREIHILWLALFGLVGGSGLFLKWGSELWILLFPNFLLISFILFLLVIGTRMYKGVKVMDQQLGWGDVVMLYALACWWEGLYFLYFYTLSLCLFSLGFLLFQYVGKWEKEAPIPLAGLWSLAFLIVYPFYHF